MKRSVDIIKKYNIENLTVINPTKTEIGIFNSSVKKIIKGFYLNKKEKEDKLGLIESDEEFICEEHRLYYKDNPEYSEYYKDNQDDDWYYDEHIKPLCDSCSKELRRIYDINLEINNRINRRYSIWNSACFNTVFSDDLISRFILARRNTKDSYRKTKLETALNESIKMEILSVFQEQNKELIKNQIN